MMSDVPLEKCSTHDSQTRPNFRKISAGTVLPEYLLCFDSSFSVFRGGTVRQMLKPDGLACTCIYRFL